ncbi:MAG: hypothetical protein WD875_07880 [Pirellulales bacterium]
MAGLTFLSGCGGPGADVPNAIATRGAAAVATDSLHRDAEARTLASRHTIDAAVVPAWYEFGDPPLPLLHAADGQSATSDFAAEGNPAGVAQSEPTVVLPSAPADGVTRLPPERLPDAPEPPSSRYDVGGRYALDGQNAAASEAVDETVDRLPPVDAVPLEAPQPNASDELPLDVPALVPPLSASPLSASPSAEPPRAPREEVRRLPPVDESAGTDDSASVDDSTPVGSAPVVESFQAATPAAPVEQRNYARPSDAFADEARPVSRFERLPPVEDVAPRAETSAAAAPAYREDQFAPPPFVLPPVENIPGADRAPLAVAQPPRHREMDLINQRAGESVRLGNELAHRGALYSAQSEFATALRVIAQALDAQENGSRHAASLDAGLAALDESDDFLASARSSTSTVDVAAAVAKHRTPVLKDAPPQDLTPITALQRYYTYAQEQLAAAAEHEPAASNALYGMGKVQTTLQATRTGTLADGPKAIALHQAALLVDDRNFMAANELGVLMARCGRYDVARAALAHSASISPQPAVWRNLAAVHDRLGETALAANARAAAENSARNIAQSPATSPTLQQPVVWLEPMAFAQSAQPQADLQRGQPAATPAAPPQPPQTSNKKSGLRWPLW